MASHAALWPRTCAMVSRVSLRAENVMGEKAIQALSARIAVVWIVLQPARTVADSTAGVSSLAQHFAVFRSLGVFGFEASESAMSAPRKQAHDPRQKLNKRSKIFQPDDHSLAPASGMNIATTLNAPAIAPKIVIHPVGAGIA